MRLFSHTWRHLIEHQKKILFSESIFYFPLRLSTGEVLVEYVALAQISFFLYLLCFIFVECMHERCMNSCMYILMLLVYDLNE